jgi:hypothetical protein
MELVSYCFNNLKQHMLHTEHNFLWSETSTLRKVDQKHLESFEM